MDRRTALKGIGVGVAGFPLLGEGDTSRETGLSVSVEAGEGDMDDWVPRSKLTDSFKAKIDVSGIEPGVETPLAYMVAPAGPEDGFVSSEEIHANYLQKKWSSDTASFVHESWNPDKLITTWPSGTYHLYATVADRNQDRFGSGISGPFEITV